MAVPRWRSRRSQHELRQRRGVGGRCSGWGDGSHGPARLPPRARLVIRNSCPPARGSRGWRRPRARSGELRSRCGGGPDGSTRRETYRRLDPLTRRPPDDRRSHPHPCIVVGFDGSQASHVALSRAIERVGPHGKLYLVHAWDVPEAWRGRGTHQPFVDRALTDAEAVIERAREMHPGLRGITWESELIGGPAAKAIADVANVRGADEIILGTRGFGSVRALLGSVAHELIHLAPCPVTVIPEQMVERDAAAAAAALTATPA